MKKKICPYCDRVMKRPGYCGFCHRLVAHPAEREINYFLNERHPETEENCSYHGQFLEENGREQQSARKIRTPVPPARQRHPEPPESQAVLKDRKKKWNPISTVILIYMMLATGTSLTRGLSGFWGRPEGHFAPEPEMVQEETQELESWRRTDDEVREAGVACNAFGHLAVSREEAVSAFQGTLGEAGYSMEESYQGSLNAVQEEYHAYNTFYVFDLLWGGESKGILEFSFDTATDELHGIQLHANEEEIKKASEAVFQVMMDLGFLSDKTDIRILFEDLRTENQGVNMSMTERDDLDFFMEISEGGEENMYRLQIYAKGYLT